MLTHRVLNAIPLDQGKAPCVGLACADCPGFLVPGGAGAPCKDRKISPKVFCAKFFCTPWGHGHPRVRVMDVRTQVQGGVNHEVHVVN